MNHESEGKSAHLPTTQNEWPEKPKKIELLNLPELHNARLRGWQRITAKLKNNNCNHRGSMGLETPRVDSPS
ncbi:hypothetical protein B9J89_06275 [Vibrio sp. V15_P4S5T153]|nr:hypothetical protein B9J89_06275 [Vibrio sp. V15_P4S5T153]